MMAGGKETNFIGCCVLMLTLAVRSQDSQNQDLRRSHNAGRQAGTQGHQVFSSGGQGGHSSFSAASSQSGRFVSSNGQPYYDYRPPVSSSGRRQTSVVATDVVGTRQTYDYPFGPGQIHYVNSETHRSTDLHGRTGYSSSSSSSSSSSNGITDRSNSNSTHIGSRNTGGGDRTRTYSQQQWPRYSSGSSGYEPRAHQRAGYVAGYDGRANQGSGYHNSVTNQRRTYNTGQVYNSYHVGEPGRTRTGGGQTTGRYFTRTRYIQPGYGPAISQDATAQGPYVSQGSHNSGGASQGYSRTSYVSQGSGGTASGQARRIGTRVYPSWAAGTQTTGTRTSAYRRNANRGRNAVYGRSRLPSRSTEECPDTGVELRLGGLACDEAVRRHGLALCYSHQFASRRCCQACRPRRNPNKPGCEYGDRAVQCSTIRPADCYNAENRRICCQSCERLRRSDTPGCEYGDRSNQCDAIRRNSGLCYHADNRRMCCQTCTHIRDDDRPDCPWGDRNSQQCQPFEANSTRVRINCYSPRTRNACCNSCRRLREWVPDDIPAGCEYGDQPVTFLSPQVGQLTCSTYFNHFPVQHCALSDSDVARHCCYTCHRRLTHHDRNRG